MKILKLLKNSAKKVLPKDLWYLFDASLSVRHKCNLKKWGNSTMRIVFLLQFPETWNSLKSVYEAACNKGFKTDILCIPKPLLKHRLGQVVDCDVNEAYEYCMKAGLSCIKADKEDLSYVDVKRLKPDYIFYCRPYNAYLPEAYRSNNLCSIAKLCYIPYAYSMLEGDVLKTTYNRDFLRYITFVFMPNQSKQELCRKEYRCYIKYGVNHFEYLGFPRFDLLSCKKNISGKYIILWMPRWEISSEKSGQKNSHFLDYYKSFINLANNDLNIKLIIRPHPLMFDNFIEKNVISQKDIEDFKAVCSESENIVLDTDKDYIPMLSVADVLVADYTSLLMEFFISGKPIIYCDNADNLSVEAKLMDKTLYHAECWEQIRSKINTLKLGVDEKKAQRQHAIEQLIPGNVGTIGETILNYLIDDWRNY